MKYGIKETKEALIFGLALSKGLKSALADGKIGIGDLDEAFGLLSPLQKAVEGGFMIPMELADLQPGEWDELIATAKPLIEDVTPDQLEALVWKALAAVKLILEAVGIIK